MNYYTYWSLLDTPDKAIRSYSVCLYIGIIALTLWFVIKRYKKSNGDIDKLILLWFFGLTAIVSFSMFSFLKLYDKDESYQVTKRFLESSKVGKVEGKISGFYSFRPLNRRGKVVVEGFKVDSVAFKYSDEFLSRFNRFTKTNNGVFKNGLAVRITYGKIKHEILKVEIAK